MNPNQIFNQFQNIYQMYSTPFLNICVVDRNDKMERCLNKIVVCMYQRISQIRFSYLRL